MKHGSCVKHNAQSIFSNVLRFFIWVYFNALWFMC